MCAKKKTLFSVGRRKVCRSTDSTINSLRLHSTRTKPNIMPHPTSPALRKSSRTGKPISRLGDTPPPSPTSPPKSTLNHDLITAPTPVPEPVSPAGEPTDPVVSTICEDVSVREPWDGYTKSTLYEMWLGSKGIIADLKSVHTSLRRSIISKDRMISAYELKISKQETKLDRVESLKLEIEKIKLDKKALGEKISSLKKEKLASDKAGKQALDDLKERHKLSFATQKMKNEAELNKLKLELVTKDLSHSATVEKMNRLYDDIKDLRVKAKKYDEFRSMETKTEIQKRAALDRVKIQ